MEASEKASLIVERHDPAVQPGWQGLAPPALLAGVIKILTVISPSPLAAVQKGRDFAGKTEKALQALRSARATDDLNALMGLHRDGLGLDVIARFADHGGFDGVIPGKKDWACHLEFTRHPDHPAGRAPTQENLLVLYIPDHAAWTSATLRMQAAGHQPVASLPPFRDRTGVTYEDPDGYHVVLQNAGWGWAAAGAEASETAGDVRHDFFRPQLIHLIARLATYPGRGRSAAQDGGSDHIFPSASPQPLCPTLPEIVAGSSHV